MTCAEATYLGSSAVNPVLDLLHSLSSRRVCTGQPREYRTAPGNSVVIHGWILCELHLHIGAGLGYEIGHGYSFTTTVVIIAVGTLSTAKGTGLPAKSVVREYPDRQQQEPTLS